jgi:hypothetical protein
MPSNLFRHSHDCGSVSGRRVWIGSLLPAPLERPGGGEVRVENGRIGECKDVVFGNDVESHGVPKQIRKPSRESE